VTAIERTVADAAHDYVRARVRLHGADQAGVLDALARVDEAWHALHLAFGVPCADVADGPIGDEP
jgi:hypothetical protein